MTELGGRAASAFGARRAPIGARRSSMGLAAEAERREIMDFVQRVLASARQCLGMDMALVSELTDDRAIYRFADGDLATFGLESVRDPTSPDPHQTYDKTYCHRMLDGRLPNAVPDTGSDPVARSIPSSRLVRSYIGVPIELGDGRTYGTLCCVDRDTHRWSERDVAFLRSLAELISGEVERYDRIFRDHKAREERIRLALEEDAISTVFQPVFDLTTGVVVGIEALSRFELAPPQEPRHVVRRSLRSRSRCEHGATPLEASPQLPSAASGGLLCGAQPLPGDADEPRDRECP